MRRPIRLKPSDLFSAPASLPVSLPTGIRAELVNLLSALLLEVMSHRQHNTNTGQLEAAHEQQDHA